MSREVSSYGVDEITMARETRRLRDVLREAFNERYSPEDIIGWATEQVEEIALRNGWMQRADGSWSSNSARRIDVRI